MAAIFQALPTAAVRALQKGGLDANGQAPERLTSDGSDAPCRHCLRMVDTGAAYLVLAYRPFASVQPYAEVGPIFLHADLCTRATASSTLPAALTSVDYIVRGYDRNERIVYGTGGVVLREQIVTRAEDLFEDARVDFVHVRSARNNCFQCRIDRV